MRKLLLLFFISLPLFGFTQEMVNESKPDSITIYCRNRLSHISVFYTKQEIIEAASSYYYCLDEDKDIIKLDSLFSLLEKEEYQERSNSYKNADLRMVILVYLKNRIDTLSFDALKNCQINQGSFYEIEDEEQFFGSMKEYLEADFGWYKATKKEVKESKRNRIIRSSPDWLVPTGSELPND